LRTVARADRDDAGVTSSSTEGEAMVNLALSGSYVRPVRPGVLAARLLRVAGGCGGAAARYLRNRRGERQLAEMSDHQLHDLGITRGDIARVAWQRER
jgi:uncharacterized protein YjiS (DUF1127 family)